MILRLLRWLFGTADEQQETETLMQIKQGDTRPRVRDELDADLEDATVRFLMQADDGSMLVDSEATVEDVETGEVSYRFSDGETDRVGEHDAEWVVEWATERESFPKSTNLEVEVVESLDRDAAAVTE